MDKLQRYGSILLCLILLCMVFTACGSKEITVGKEGIPLLQTHKTLFQEAVAEIMAMDPSVYFISHTDRQKPMAEEPMSGVYTTTKAEGDCMYQPLHSSIMERIFSFPEIDYILCVWKEEEMDCIWFICRDSEQRKGETGFYYAADPGPRAFRYRNMELWKEGRGWGWKSEDGKLAYFTQSISENWYYYESKG